MSFVLVCQFECVWLVCVYQMLIFVWYVGVDEMIGIREMGKDDVVVICDCEIVVWCKIVFFDLGLQLGEIE